MRKGTIDLREDGLYLLLASGEVKTNILELADIVKNWPAVCKEITLYPLPTDKGGQT